jgi:hypothetical protein
LVGVSFLTTYPGTSLFGMVIKHDLFPAGKFHKNGLEYFYVQG